jgi:hypothetical protein
VSLGTWIHEDMLKIVELELYSAAEQEYPRCDLVCECDFEVPKNLLTPVLPRKGDKGKGLIWDLADITGGVYTSVDIWRAMTHGYKLLRVTKALQYKGEAPVFEKFIEMQFAIRKLYPDKKSVQNILAKLMMNSLYGKTIQQLKKQMTEIVYNHKELDRFRKDKQMTGIFFMEDPLGEATDFINIEEGPTMVQGDRSIEITNKPTSLGAFVLSYSRYIMDHFYDQIDAFIQESSMVYYRY